MKSDLERAAAPHLALAEAAAAGRVAMSPILAAIGIDPKNPTHQAALLACDKYDLDPLLKHIIVIPGSGPYITRDGWLHIAHRDGRFDGMRVTGESDTQSHWTARVAVYRKDMTHPFEYTGRYPKNGKNSKYGPEMAIKVAEVMALRRAFDVGVAAYEERWEKDEDEQLDRQHAIAQAALAELDAALPDSGDVYDVEPIEDQVALDDGAA